MSLATIVFIGMSFTVSRSKRIFHYITAAITLTAAVAYFTMASNLGYASIEVEFHRSNPKVSGNLREIFYVRYIDWFVTTPVRSHSFLILGPPLIMFAASPLGSLPYCWSSMAHYFVHYLP
jgi:bacteriorhodopsin